MSTIAVLGVTGYLGRLILRELAGQRHSVIAVARDRDRATSVLDDAGISRDSLRIADVASTPALREALKGSDLAIGAFGSVSGTSGRVFTAAIDAGVHLVDLTVSPSLVQWAFEDGDVKARRAGSTIVPAAAADGLLGDLLAGLAADAIPSPTEIHIASASLGAGDQPSPWPRRLRTSGQRSEQALQLGRPIPAWVDGQLSDEWPGEQRRLAWFPRPVGPAHAAAVAGTHALTVPRHVTGVRTVRTYRALPTWRAELLQLIASLARHDRLRRWRVQRLAREHSSPSVDLRARRRWAFVAEAGNPDQNARAWANGRDIDRVTVVGALVLAESILAGRADAGVLPPSCVDVPQEMLDTLSARADLRWSIVRPDG